MHCVVKVHTSTLKKDRKWYVFFFWITCRFFGSAYRTAVEKAVLGGGDDCRNFVIDPQFQNCALHMEIDRACAEVKDSGTLIRSLAISRQFQYIDLAGGQMRRGRLRRFLGQCLCDQRMQVAPDEH